MGGSVTETLDTLLHPRSVAIVGASSSAESLGGRPLGLLTALGFAGTVYPVNPTHDTVQGHQAYRSVLDLPERVDLALVAVRARLVLGVLRECAQAGIGTAIVLSSGFGEGTGVGADLRDELLDWLRTTPLRVLGPNCEGLASLPARAPLTFSPVMDARRTGAPVRAGGVAVVSHSGGLGFAVAQWGSAVGVGFNYLVSTGNELDLDLMDVAEHLVEREDTTVVVMLVEGLRDHARLVALHRRARALGTRLLLAKLGRTTAGARGTLAHTAHDAGTHAELAALCMEEGIPLVGDERTLIDVLQALDKCPQPAGRRVGILTTSGGAGIWLADACEEQGLTVPSLSPALQAAMAAHMPDYGSPVNPVDLTAQFIAGGEFSPAIETMLASGEVDALVLATSLASSGRLERDRPALAALAGRYPVPLLVYSYTNPAPSCVTILDELRLPWFTSSTGTAAALARLAPVASLQSVGSGS
jgi:acyl-CoA synthetase (NDP forming)